jgi:hypothetical protein
MSSLDMRLMEIALRKDRLKMRADIQRQDMHELFREVDGPARIVDRGFEAVHFLRNHPALVAAGVAGLLALRRRSVLSIAGSLLSAWRLWNALSAWRSGQSR